jgi:hypothetical protein
MDESNRCASLFSLGLGQQQLQVIGGKPVSQTQILTQSQMHASMVREEELAIYGNNDKDRYENRYKEIYEGEIGTSLKEHFLTALRLPLHPLAGKQPNDPYVPTEGESPLAHAALAFVHAGFSLKYRQFLERFPETINQVSTSLLERVQACAPRPPVFRGGKHGSPRYPPCMHLYIPLNFAFLT